MTEETDFIWGGIEIKKRKVYPANVKHEKFVQDIIDRKKFEAGYFQQYGFKPRGNVLDVDV